LAYNVTYKKSVQKDLAHLGKAETRRLLDKIEGDLADRADTYPVLKGRFAGLRKLRVGNYRVVFVVVDQDVIVLRIAHRREVYK